MSSTVCVHIGLAKSGTTYLQHVLAANQELLLEHGVLFPVPMYGHFMAALDLSGANFASADYPLAAGAWDRLAAEVAEHPGMGLISHEMFAPASRKHVAKAVADLGADDVRIVITARDLGRQVPAVWQERIKNGAQDTYGDYLLEVFRSEEGRAQRGRFWRQQHLPGIASRWSRVVGPENLTVVTVPQSGADPRELWRRFASAAGLPELDYDLDAAPRNPSLGVVESELLRRLNGALPTLERQQYARRVKRRFSESALSATTHSGRIGVPKEYAEDVADLAERAITAVQRLGCLVVGDLDDLRPLPVRDDPPLPDDVPDSEILSVALTHLGTYVAAPPATPPAAREKPAPGVGAPREQPSPDPAQPAVSARGLLHIPRRLRMRLHRAPGRH